MRDIYEMGNEANCDISCEEALDFEKVSIDFNSAAGMLFGYSSGHRLGTMVGQEKGKVKALRNSEVPSIEGDYYSQVRNISKNLRVLFSPVSVLYIVDDNGKAVTLDTIQASEMDETMREYFSQRDKEYFKNLFLNKMILETQYAEIYNARKLVKNFNNITKEVTGHKKESSELYGVNMEVLAIQELYKNGSYALQSTLEKTAMGIETNIKLELERPISNYSEIGDYELFKVAKMTMDEYKQKDFLNRKYVAKNLRIGFVGNRVVFTINDTIVSQLKTMDMNKEMFEKFKYKDSDYFRKLFLDEANEVNMVKKASIASNAKDLFSDSKVPIKVYYTLFNKKYGNEWLTYDTEQFIKMVELDFKLEKAIVPVVLDKMFLLQNVCSTNDCLSNAFIFEKVCRAINDKPVDFSEYEYNLTAVEIIKALQIIDELTPNNDIFDNLTTEVLTYITKALVLADCRCVVPNRKIISSKFEEMFFQTLNKDLTYRWTTMNKIEHTYQSIIQPFVASVVNIVRKEGKYDSDMVDIAIKEVSEGYNIYDERALNLVRQNVVINLSLDMVLDKYAQETEESIKNLEL